MITQQYREIKMIKLTHILGTSGPLRSKGPLQEGKMPFSKNDWDVKWNVAKGTRKDSEAAVNARWKAIRGLMGGEHKSIRRFVKETTMWKSLTYDEFVKWYTQLLKELS
jgi:hypothetical protein